MKFAISILSLLMLLAIKSILGMPVSLTKIAQEHSNLASCKVCDSSNGKTCCPQ